MPQDAADHADNPYRAPSADAAGDPSETIGTREALASRGQRLGAYLIDVMLFIVPSFGLGIAGVGTGALDNANVLVVLAGMLLLGIALTNLVLLGTRGQTLGKYTLGIKIVRASSHREASGVRIILGRELSRSVITGLPGIGPIGLLADSLAIFQDSQQCLHDMIADTNVIRTDSDGGDQWDREWEQNRRQASNPAETASPFDEAPSPTDPSQPDTDQSSENTQPSDDGVGDDLDGDGGDVHW